MAFFDNLKKLCEKKGVKIYILERDLGYSNGSINRLKDGGIPKVERLKEIADYFGVTPDYLLTGEEPATQEEKERIYYSDPAALSAADFIFNNPQYSILIETVKKIDKRDIPLATALLERFASGN